MEEEKREDTALGVARQRFIEGLPRRAAELRSAVASLAASPDNDRARDELRRRLHAVYASAQVFRVEPLAGALKEAIQRIDSAREGGPALARPDIETFESLAGSIPRLAGSDVDVPQSASRSAPPMRVPSRGRETQATRPSREGRGTVSLGRGRKPTGSFTTQTRAGEVQRPSNVVSVLVLDDVETQTVVRSALVPERFELTVTDDPEQALRLARSIAPDVVLADRSILLRPGVDFVGRLRGDPLTDFVPIVMLLPQGAPHDPIAVRDAGADDAISKPLEESTLRRTVERLTTGQTDGVTFEALGDLTADEIADRVAREVRRGIVESIALGQSLKVPVGDGSEVLAAAWAAIARLRSHIADRSGGRVLFRDAPGRGPALLALANTSSETAEQSTEVSLLGRRIVVADDDPAVVWFFTSLLREAGAEPIEAANGRIALEEARRVQPDLIISDILMPELDGFGLCREIRRDPVLAEVPIIVLSWKEDFLQRMRDLRAGASDYLRKEAGSAQILSQVRAALRPRARLEAQLRAGGEVRGRTDGVGMSPLLRLVAKQRPSSRVTVRDAWNLFEVEIREGTLVDVTRTATDGTFARGHVALPSLLGVGSGRFTVADTDVTARKALTGTIDALIDEAAHTLRAQLQAVSGQMLPLVERVTFRPDVLAAYLRASPEPIRELVQRLHQADSPRRMLLRAEVDPRTLENTLVDLVRRGALERVLGHNGEDLIGKPLPPLASRPPPAPAQAFKPRGAADPRDVVSVAEVATESDPSEVIDPAALGVVEVDRLSSPGAAPVAPIAEPVSEDRTLPDAVPMTGELEEEAIDGAVDAAFDELQSEPPPKAELEVVPEPAIEVPLRADRHDPRAEPSSSKSSTGERAIGKVVLSKVARRSVPQDRRLDEFELLAEAEEADERISIPGSPPSNPPSTTTEAALDRLETIAARNEARRALPGDKKSALTVSAELDLPRTPAPPRRSAERGEPSQPIALERRSGETPLGTPSPAEAKRRKREDDTPVVVERKKKKSSSAANVAAKPKAPPPPPETAGPGTTAWLLLVVLFGVVGFVGYRMIQSAANDEAEHERPRTVTPRVVEEDEPEPEPEAPSETPEEAPAEVPTEGGMRRAEMIDVGREVAPNEGGLLVESTGDDAWTVRTDQQDLGTTPVRAALPEGRHRLVLTNGDRNVFRYVLIEPGTTFVLRLD